MEPRMTVEGAHEMITRDAEDMANAELSREPGFERFSGQVFHADPVERQPGQGGLALTIEPMALESLGPREVERLHEIGRKALKDAIEQNRAGLAALIVGHAKAGQNYFDRFMWEGSQRRLF